MTSTWAVVVFIAIFCGGVAGRTNCDAKSVRFSVNGSCNVGFYNGVCTLFCFDLHLFPDIEDGEILKTTKIRDSYVPSIKAQMFKNTPALTKVIMQYCKLETVDNGTFSALQQLKTISLSWNPLKIESINNILCSIPQGIHGIRVVLRGLVLEEDKHYISESMLECVKYRNISSLDLSLNLVTEQKMKRLFCAGKSHVKVFNFNSITLKDPIKMDKDIFKCLNGVSTDHLGLSNNALHGITAESFVYLSNLRSIDLSSCELSRHVKNISQFSGMKRLKKLKVVENFYIDFEAFSKEPKGILDTVEVLDLSKNRFLNIKPFSENVFVSLKTLNISQNIMRIIGLPDGLIENLHSLQTLKLNKNTFVILVGNAFRSKSLETLELKDMQIIVSDIKEDIFKYASNLSSISLDGLNSKIYNKTKYLDPLGKFLNYTFRKLTNLKKLSLRSIKMTTLFKNMFKGTDKLQSLDFSHNSIYQIAEGCISHLSQLEYLNLDRNNIETVNRSQLPHPENNLLLSLSFNSWACDCNLYWFHTILTSKNSTIVFDSDKENYICNSPLDMHGVHVTDNNPIWRNCFSNSLKSTYVIIVHLSTTICLVLLIASLVLRFRWHIYYIYINTRARVRGYKELSDSKFYQYDAFVSYNKDDLAWVIGCLRKVLEQKKGLTLCLHDRDWLAGVDIVENIQQSIERSRKVVLIITNAFARSNWCQLELTMAQHRLFSEDRDNLILVMKEKILDCYMTPRLALQLKTQTYIEWDESEMGQKVFWKRLVKAISSHGGSLKNRPIN